MLHEFHRIGLQEPRREPIHSNRFEWSIQWITCDAWRTGDSISLITFLLLRERYAQGQGPLTDPFRLHFFAIALRVKFCKSFETVLWSHWAKRLLDEMEPLSHIQEGSTLAPDLGRPVRYGCVLSPRVDDSWVHGTDGATSA